MIGPVSKLIFLVGLGALVITLFQERRDSSTISLVFIVISIGVLYLFIPILYSIVILILTVAYLPLLFIFSLFLNYISVYIEDNLALKHFLGKKLEKEVGRKIFHLIILIFFLPVRVFRWFFLTVNSIMNFIGFETFFTVSFVTLILLNVGGALLPSLILENFRLKGRLRIQSSILRDKEKYSIGGYIYFLSVGFFLSLLFIIVESIPENLLLGGITAALIYDMFSGLIGCSFGKMYIRDDRSLSGAIGGFTATVLTSIKFLPLKSTLLIGIFLSFLDVINPPINDNLYFPLGTLLLILCYYTW